MRGTLWRFALCAVAALSGLLAAIKSRARAEDGAGGSFSYVIAIDGDGRAAIRTTTLISPEILPQIACELGGVLARPRASAAVHSEQQMSWTDGGCLVQTEDAFDSVDQLDGYLRQAGAGSIKMEGCSFALSLTLRFDAANPIRSSQVEVIMPGLKSETAGATQGDEGPNSLMWVSDVAPGAIVTIGANGTPAQCLWAVAHLASTSDPVGHAFVIFERRGERDPWGFYPQESMKFPWHLIRDEQFVIAQTAFEGEVRLDGKYLANFGTFLKTGSDPDDGLFAYRVYAVSSDQFTHAKAVLNSWKQAGSSEPYSIDHMCGTFVHFVFAAAGIAIGGPKAEDNRPTALYRQLTQ